MKGLTKIPNQKKLLQAYKALQFSPHSVRIKDLVHWSQWSRLDPRLGEILVEYIAKFWNEHNPVTLNQQLKKQVWPAAFGVLLEQVPFYYSQNSYQSGLKTEVHLFCLPPEDRTPTKAGIRKKHQNSNRVGIKTKKWNKKLFLHWSKCVMTDISPAKNEQFFIGLYKAGGKLAKEECFYSIKPYRQWGYFSKDLLINKAKATEKTLIPIHQREAIINELLKSHKRITVQDYLEKMNFQIHRRQAQRDLKNHKKLKAYGQTKNRYYKVSTGKGSRI